VKEFEWKLEKKDGEGARGAAELARREEELGRLEQRAGATAGLEAKLVEAERRAEQGRREAIDLKSYQRKLEGG
jgi:hypothetical protein